VRRPTARGIAAAGLGASLLAAGSVWRYPGVVMLGVALLGLVVVAVVSVLGPAPIRVQRRVFPVEVTRFGTCTATLRVERPGGVLPFAVDTTDHVAGMPVPLAVPPLRGRNKTEVSYPVPTQRRGVLTIGPLDLQRRAIGGLAEKRAALRDAVTVRVLPRVLPVSGMPGGVRRAHAGADERVPHGGTDLIGLHEYLAGDDLRRLHWATSARLGKLMVRDDAEPSSAHLTLLLDDRLDSYADPDDMEDAVEVAASLAVAAASTEHGVRLLTVCGQVEHTLLPTPGVPVDARDVVSVLAGVVAQPTRIEPGPLPVSALDVVAVLTGSAAELGRLVEEAGRAAVGVVTVVDATPGAPAVVTAGGVTVLRGAGTVDLLGRWDAAVVH
jgi:uncharacterized protein (DUF58 family)